MLSASATVALLLMAQSTVNIPSDRWLCTSQTATGFFYDRSNRAWKPTTFKPEGRFIVAAIPMKGEMAPFQWVIAPEGEAVIMGGFCGKTFSAGTFLHCSGLGGTFSFNQRSQRYSHYFPGGYVAYAPGVNDLTDETADTPFLEIGTCSRL